MGIDVDYHFDFGDDYNQEEFERVVEGYDVEITQYEDRDGLTLSGSHEDVNGLLSEPREDESAKAAVRTMLGKQYSEPSDIPGTREIVADGGSHTEEGYQGSDWSHTPPEWTNADNPSL